MEVIVGNTDHWSFDIELILENQYGGQVLPFVGMDKSGSAVCNFFLRGTCEKGIICPFRHVKGDRSVVCKHWLRGLCKKGDDCEFLHEYDMSKMPECYFFSKFGQCGNKECPFQHIDPEKKMKDCPWYDRGFCRHGPLCKNRHVRRMLCQNYLCGFCLDGPNCKFQHPSFDIPQPDQTQVKKSGLICHFCNQPGHKAATCHKLMTSSQSTTKDGEGEKTTAPSSMNRPHHQFTFERPRKSLSEIVCYKCGEQGHYASRCSKNYLAFLSHPVPQTS